MFIKAISINTSNLNSDPVLRSTCTEAWHSFVEVIALLIQASLMFDTATVCVHRNDLYHNVRIQANHYW